MRNFKNCRYNVLSILLVVVTMSACSRNRFPVSPEAYETRRPQVGFVLPADGDTVSVDSLSTITIWFDELMNHGTMPETVTLSLTISGDAWESLNYMNHLSQSRTNADFLVASRDNPGSFYSTDQGNSWLFIKGLAERIIKFIVIDQNDASVLYAATNSELLKSNDGGENWITINNNLPPLLTIMHLSLDPLNSKKLWLGTSAGVFMSTDEGMNWSETGILPSWVDQEMTQIAIDEKNTSVIYISTLGRFIYKSEDNGNTWELKRGISGLLGTSRIYDIAIDPDSSNIIFAASINQGVYRSNDGGENWFTVNNGVDDVNARILNFHRQDNNRLYLATNSNLFVSADKAQSWQRVAHPAGINIKSFFGDSQNSSRLYLATANSIYMSNDKGNTWDESGEIEFSSIQTVGSFSYTTWRDTLRFYVLDEEDRPDTVTISPYRYDDALAAYDAGLISEPPVEPNPSATKITFSPAEKLYRNWHYRLRIRGAFEGNQWRGKYGARDLSGMSLQYDYISTFVTK
jgi:photosystem II stability/assembly factor-like uncharacterized protein